jgi:Asp-tRNA(Asn)/Glu-tRNA(Gln) amidotransferase C subunit
MTDGTEVLRDEIRKVGNKVDHLSTIAEGDRKFLQSLHADHLRLESRVKLSEERIQKTQGDLDRHIEVACVIQEATRKDVAETKEMLKAHVAQEDLDRREVIKHMREATSRIKWEGKSILMWAVGTGTSIVLALFGLLWATGTIGS